MQPVPPITSSYQFWAFVILMAFQAWQLWLQRQSQQQLGEVTKTTGEIVTKQVEQHQATNSRMDELLKVAKAAAHAEGKAEGISEERATAVGLLADKKTPPSPIEVATGAGSPQMIEKTVFGPSERLEEIRGQL